MNELSYTLSFGDGTPNATGCTERPQRAISVQHAYTVEGLYSASLAGQ